MITVSEKQERVLAVIDSKEDEYRLACEKLKDQVGLEYDQTEVVKLAVEVNRLYNELCQSIDEWLDLKTYPDEMLVEE